MIAAVQNDSCDELLAKAVAHAGKPSEPVQIRRLPGFDLDADNSPIVGFENEINLCTGPISPMKECRIDIGTRTDLLV